MTQFKGSATVFRVLKALEWHEKADDLSLPSDSYAAIPTLDRDEALEWFSEKLRLTLTFEGDPGSADYLLEEAPESLPYMAHTAKPTIPVFVVRAMAAHPQAAQGAGCGQTSA